MTFKGKERRVGCEVRRVCMKEEGKEILKAKISLLLLHQSRSRLPRPILRLIELGQERLTNPPKAFTAFSLPHYLWIKTNIEVNIKIPSAQTNSTSRIRGQVPTFMWGTSIATLHSNAGIRYTVLGTCEHAALRMRGRCRCCVLNEVCGKAWDDEPDVAFYSWIGKSLDSFISWLARLITFPFTVTVSFL